MNPRGGGCRRDRRNRAPATRTPKIGRYYRTILEEVAQRQALLSQVLADRPVVHYLSYEDLQAGRLTGVWATDESCYRFLAERCHRGSRTLETGSGISTILFAAWSAHHRCITPSQVEADAIVSYCQERDIPLGALTFDIASSDIALNRMAEDKLPLDIVLIDGCHGFPAPMLDWYFGASRLRKGGVAVLDDLQLPAVALLRNFLDQDSRWHRVDGTAKWAAYERRTEGPLLEDWYLQPFYVIDRPDWRTNLRRVARSLARRGRFPGR